MKKLLATLIAAAFAAGSVTVSSQAPAPAPIAPAVPATPTAPAAPDDAADAHYWERKLGAALGDLPDEQAQMLKLAYYDDRSHSEIAEALHVPLGTVKSRLRLAIGRLRAKFEDKQ